MAQTYPRWEILLMDDGSSDDTEAIVGRYRDPRIRYTRRAHQGLAGLADLYNQALRAARGELIAILEADDFWPPDKLATLIPAFERADVVLAYGLTQSTDSTGKPIDPVLPLELVRRRFPARTFDNDPIGSAGRGILISHSLWTCPVSTIIRRRALHAIDGFQTIPGGSLVDRPTFLRLALQGRFVFVPKVMGYWRRHECSSTASVAIWECMAAGIYAYVSEFMLHYADVLRLSASEQRQVRQFWKSNALTAKMAHGRLLLREGRWPLARAKFVEAMRSAGAGRRLVSSALGYVASYVHRDIEWLYRTRARLSVPNR